MRKTREVTVVSEGRDQGKTFFLTEMAAEQQESWAFRAFGAMTRSGVDIPPEIIASGMAGLTMVGLKALFSAPWIEVHPLLTEMMDCVQWQSPELRAEGGDPLRRKLLPASDDIEEASTRIFLRDKVFELCTGFSIAGALLTGTSALQTLMDMALSTTLTSLESSEQSSQADLPL